MSKEKQIEEMASIIENTYLPINQGDTTVGETTLRSADSYVLADSLYNTGYRKQSEGEWIDKPTGHTDGCNLGVPLVVSIAESVESKAIGTNHTALTAEQK